MCFGVRDAIALALEHSKPEPITILGELVHNSTVLDHLRSQGVHIEHQLTNVRTPAVMITAHGASQTTMNRVRERGLNIVEATCPLVHYAHRAVSRLVQDGYYPIIIGKRDHVEVRGLTEDLAEFSVVLTEDDVANLPIRVRYGIASQTTQPIDRVRYLVDLIGQRFPDCQIRFADTVCQPTKQRQNAAAALARQSDVVIVVGGANSNNTRELVNTCCQFCPRVHHVQGPTDLRQEWFDGVETIGLTAGTSTPDPVIDAVEAWLNSFSHRFNTQPTHSHEENKLGLDPQHSMHSPGDTVLHGGDLLHGV